MSSRARDNRRAGLITMAVIVLGSILIMALPRWLGERRIEYLLVPTADVDLTGLGLGAPVLVGGLERGRITSIDDEVDSSGAPQAVVRVELRRDPPIYPQALPILRVNPISQRAIVDFLSVGDPGRGGAPLDAGARLTLRPEQAGDAMLGGSLGPRLTRLTEGFEALSEPWTRMRDDAPQRFGSVRDQALSLRDEISATWDGIVARGNETLDRYRALEEGFTQLIDSAKSLRSDIEALQALGDDGAPIARIRGEFRAIADAWHAMIERSSNLRSLVDGISAEWSRSMTGLERMRVQFEEIAGAFAMSDVLADLRVTGNLFAKLYAEAFASPWRLVLPNESAPDERRRELDALVRSLLASLEEAQEARVAIASLLEAGQATGTNAVETLERLERNFDALSSFEDLLWRARFGEGKRQ